MIADDLTGANDTGLQFARYGLKTSVVMRQGSSLPGSAERAVDVVNTDSRSFTAYQAYESMKATLSGLEFSNYDLIYKKIDSTLRGNIGSEINALMDFHPFDVAVVAPAYPAHGRLTIGGFHLVHNDLLEDSEAARDPRAPIRESLIPSLLAEQTKRRIGHIAVNTIRSKALSKEIESLLQTKHEILVFDSATSGDLETIANALLPYQKQVLWVGSAGLAQAIAKNVMGDIAENVQSEYRPIGPVDPVLIVAGSVNKVTRAQVENLTETGQAQVLDVPAHVLIRNDELSPYINEATSILKTQQNLVITVAQSQGPDPDVNREGDTSLRIVSRMGEIACPVITHCPLAGVVLTGGDTALEICRRLGITGLQIVGEVEEGIPITLAFGNGLYQGPIVTKAGGFGQVDSLLRAIQQLKKEEEPDA